MTITKERATAATAPTSESLYSQDDCVVEASGSGGAPMRFVGFYMTNEKGQAVFVPTDDPVEISAGAEPGPAQVESLSDEFRAWEAAGDEDLTKFDQSLE